MDENPRHALHYVYRSVHKSGTLSVKAKLVGQAYNKFVGLLSLLSFISPAFPCINSSNYRLFLPCIQHNKLLINLLQIMPRSNEAATALAAPLRVARVTAGVPKSNGSVRPGL